MLPEPPQLLIEGQIMRLLAQVRLCVFVCTKESVRERVNLVPVSLRVRARSMTWQREGGRERPCAQEIGAGAEKVREPPRKRTDKDASVLRAAPQAPCFSVTTGCGVYLLWGRKGQFKAAVRNGGWVSLVGLGERGGSTTRTV